MNTILIATDLNKMTNDVLKAGFDLAKKMEAEVLLTVIVNKNLDYFPPDTGMGFANQWEARKYLAEKQLEEIKEANPDIAIRTLACIGDPPRAIVEQAIENDASFIVIGTHGRSGVLHALMGSTAAYVVKHSTVPVLVVPFNKNRH